MYEIEAVKPGVLKNVPSTLSRITLWIPGNLWIFGLVICLLAFAFWKIMPSIGETAGIAVGSFDGVTNGIREGAEAGKEEGLSAKDIEIKIGNKMRETEKLQILLVDLKLSDLYQQGSSYAALLSLEGEAVFTVDLSLSKAGFSEEEEKFVIEIPEPQCELYLNDSTIDVLAEYQRVLFNGAAKDGYKGYLNSRAEIEKRAKEEIDGNEDLQKQARMAAIQQVEALAGAICGEKLLEVQFTEIEE